MKKIIDKNIFKDLDNWAKKGGISGKDALSIIVNDFYDAVIKERKLEKFFYGIDEQILRNHQIMFLTQLFSGKLAGGFSEKHLYESHKDLIVNRGLNQFHFKIFENHLLAVLLKNNVPQDIIDRIVKLLGPFKEVFKKATSRYSTAKEEALFFAIDLDNDGIIESSDLIKILSEEGLNYEDKRLSMVYKKLKDYENQPINFHTFSEIISPASLLIDRAITGELAIPDFKQFCEEVDAIYEDVINNKEGAVASYIPPLAEVDPDQYGIVITTVDGQVYKSGDTNFDFSIQSMCKPYNYCFALEELGDEKVHQHVGNEPSGRAFNNQELMKRYLSNTIQNQPEKIEIPFNPMINAGAIMTSALIKSSNSFEDRFSHIREQWSRLIGNSKDKKGWPRFNKEMAKQENLTGFNNIALGYLLMASGKLPKSQESPPETNEHKAETGVGNPNNYNFFMEPSVIAALKLYFAVCSLELNAEELAMAAATLANGGVCPVTLDRVLSAKTVRQCLSVTQTCGMYDGSGDFFYNIGLPAKSGVSGGILLFAPKLMGICVFSPRLDAQGNSIRGVETAKKIVEKYKVHLYDDIISNPNRVDPKRSISEWEAAKNFEALWAASNGDLNTLMKLSDIQYDLESGQYDLRTPMHLAAAEGHISIVKFLLKLGIKPKRDRWGRYPSYDARLNENFEIVDLFNDKEGIEPYQNKRSDNKKTDKATWHGNQLEVIQFLWASYRNDLKGVQRLIARGVPVDVQDSDRRTPLHLSAVEGNLELVKYLIAHGHPLFVRDRWGATPLDEAIREKREDVIKFLNQF